MSCKIGSLHLDPFQHEAATQPIEDDVQIIAGPGTGKTRTLVGRVAHLLENGVPPQCILVLSFTNRAMKTFQSRLISTIGPEKAAGVEVYTFHAFCQAALRSHAAHYFQHEATGIDWSKKWSVADQIDQAQLLAHMKRYRNYDDVLIPSNIKYTVNAIDKDKKQLLTSPDAQLMQLTQLYDKQLSQVQLVDYTDLILYGRKLIKMGGHIFLPFRNILVDEFQDTSVPKWHLVELLRKISGAALTVVGDANQSIFSFQDVDPHIFKTMQDDIPSTKVFNLPINHRSSHQITRVCNALLDGDASLQGSFEGQPPNCFKFPSRDAELEWTAAEIKRLLQENPNLAMNDFAVLARTNAEVDKAVEVLDRCGLPTYSFSSGYVLLHSEDIYPLYSVLKIIHSISTAKSAAGVFLLSLLRHKSSGPLLTHSAATSIWNYSLKHNMSLLETLIQWPELNPRVSRAAHIRKLREFMDFLTSSQQTLTGKPSNDPDSILAVLDSFIDLWGLAKPSSNYTVSRFYHFIRQMTEMPDLERPNLLENIVENLRLQNFSDNPDKLVATTVHNAKGLEWPCVFVTGVTDDMFPVQFYHKQNQNLAEERRVLYVAMTRAVDRLYVTSSATGSERKMLNYGRYIPAKPSRFLTPQVLKSFNTVLKSQEALPISSENSSYKSSFIRDYYKTKAKYPKLFVLPAGARTVRYLSTFAKRRII